MKQCSILVPNHEQRLSHEAPCLRKVRHLGPHLFFDPIRKVFISWEQDWECTDCEDECECFIFGEIPKNEALNVLREDGIKEF